MAWFGESLSSLKGQITNFTKEIVVNNVVGLSSDENAENEECSASPIQDKDQTYLEQLKLHCVGQDKEIAKLKEENEKLRRSLTKQTPRDRRVSEEATLECEAGAAASHLPLVPLDEAGTDSFLGQDHIPKDVKVEDEMSSLRSRLRQTFQEKVLMENSCSRLEKEVALLTQQVTEDRQQAQACVEAKRNAEAACKTCSHAGTQTDTDSRPPDDATLLSEENEQLRRERAQLRTELARMSRAVQDLESQVAVSQDENANLSTGMEELDIQHQEAIQQIMELKDSTQKRYELLLEEFEEMKLKYEEMENLSKEREMNIASNKNVEMVSEVKSQILNELSQEIKTMITTDIPDKYFETSKKDASVLETVAAVEKMLSHTMSRVESSESKIRELLRELRSKDDEVQEVEDENKTLRMKIEEFKEQCDNLPTINENNEDIEVLETKVMTLESNVSVLQEMRSNLEVELTSSRSEIESLIRQLQTAEAISRNQDNLETEVNKYKENERDLMRKLDDAEHTREEMLTEISQLKLLMQEQKKFEVESSESKSKLVEILHKNNELEKDMSKLKENNELLISKVSQELDHEKTLTAQLKEEKDKLLSQLKENEVFKERSRERNNELHNEQSFRLQLEEETSQLKKRIAILQGIEKEHVKLLENFQAEVKLKNELEVSLETMHAEIKRIENEEETCKQMLEKQTLDSDLKMKELKALNNCLTQKCVKFEKEIFDLTESVDNLKIEIDSKGRKMCEMILEKSATDKELKEVKSLKNHLDEELNEIKRLMNEKEQRFLVVFNDICGHTIGKDLINSEMVISIENFHSYLNDITSKFSALKQEKSKLENENSLLSENVKKLISEVNDKTECLLKLTTQMETLQAEKHSIEDRLRNIKNTVSTGNQTDQPECPAISEESFAEVHKKLEDCEVKYQELDQRYQKLLAESDQSTSQLNNQLQTLNNERQQLIEAVQTKHAECVKYHAEIQRLCGELTKAEQHRVSITEQFRTNLEEKEEQLTALQACSDRQVATMGKQIHTLQNQLDYVSQLLRVTDRQEAEGQPASDPPSVKTQPEKSECGEKETKRVEELYENFQKEQLRNKYLQDEVSEQHEKEASLMRELQRLRGHLVAVEDNYTQEMVKAEQQVQELTQRLTLAEERAKSSSTAYTSASIRANQQVESLSSQLRLLSEQKDKQAAQLAAAEDKLHKQAAALTNLQIVLEQFQRDKERDVATETERIRQTLQQANSRSAELSNEIKALQSQLKEAKEGLSAASRLTEQLDHKSGIISDLKKQVSELQDKLKKAEDRIQAASMSVEEKVDRCLVRNLVVGYVSAPPSSQQQALGIIATVLNFTHDDRMRTGLEPNTTIAHSQSLSEAFVQFLENESRPHLHLRLPLQESGESSRSRKTSVTEVGLTPARRISGSVLKDVLKQDI